MLKVRKRAKTVLSMCDLLCHTVFPCGTNPINRRHFIPSSAFLSLQARDLFIDSCCWCWRDTLRMLTGMFNKRHPAAAPDANEDRGRHILRTKKPQKFKCSFVFYWIEKCVSILQHDAELFPLVTPVFCKAGGVTEPCTKVFPAQCHGVQ